MRTARSRGEYAAVVLVGIVAAGLAVMATTGGRSWGEAAVSAEGMPPRLFVTSAREVAPWVGAAALVALAGMGAVLATAGRWRQVVGTLVLLCGLTIVGGALSAGDGVESALREEIELTAAAADPGAVDDALGDVEGQTWRWLAAVGGVGVVIAGGLVVARGSQWPAMGRRYEAPAATRSRDGTDLWRAQDAGDDPTA